MATRTIESPKHRLVTILVAPLMSCSARLPVYTVLIAACIPDVKVLGVLKLTGLTLLAMYLLGVTVALAMAWLLKKTLLKGEPPLLIMELPPYKRPLFRVVLRHMWDPSRLFLRRAGKVILGISIVLWFLATYPRSSALDQEFDAKRSELTNSFSAVSLGTGTGSATSRLTALQDQLEALNQQEAGERLRRSFADRDGPPD